MNGEIDWDRAACKNEPADFMFVAGSEQHRAKQICKSCSIGLDCLAEALDNQIEWGVWGGLTERERRAVLRKYPQVTNWRERFLAQASFEAGSQSNR